MLGAKPKEEGHPRRAGDHSGSQARRGRSALPPRRLCYLDRAGQLAVGALVEADRAASTGTLLGAREPERWTIDGPCSPGLHEGGGSDIDACHLHLELREDLGAVREV